MCAKQHKAQKYKEISRLFVKIEALVINFVNIQQCTMTSRFLICCSLNIKQHYCKLAKAKNKVSQILPLLASFLEQS